MCITETWVNISHDFLKIKLQLCHEDYFTQNGKEGEIGSFKELSVFIVKVRNFHCKIATSWNSYVSKI